MSILSNKTERDSGAIVKTKKRRGPGKPFEPGFDPRRNISGRPKSGDALAEFVRDVLDAPIKQGGRETSALNIGLNALAGAFMRGDPLAARILLDRGYGKVAESIILSRLDQEEDDNLDALPLEALELMLYFEWVARGCPEPELAIKDVKLREYAAIEQAITDSRILQRIKKVSAYSPSLLEGETEDGEEDGKNNVE